MEWMILPFRRFAEFSGRSRRKEFWLFTLLSVIAVIAAVLIDLMFGSGPESIGPVGIVVSLAFLIPSIASASGGCTMSIDQAGGSSSS